MEAISIAGFEAVPLRMELGSVRFGGWQIQPVPAAEFAGDAYLVRAAFDIERAPMSSPAMWVEVGLEFAGASVLDAVPQQVRTAVPARRHELTPGLTFAPSPNGTVPVGPLGPAIDVSGIGTSRLRWRYTAAGPHGLTPGTRTGWFVLLAPRGAEKITVRALATYQPAPVDSMGFEPGSEPVRRTVRLPRHPARTR